MRVLVIGQGLAGTLISHAALAKQWDCHVIDAGLPSASSVAAGMFNPMSFRRIVEVWDAEAHLTSMAATYSQFVADLGEPLLHFMPIHKRLPNAEYAELWNQQADKLKWISPVTFRENEINEGVVTGGGWLNLPRLILLWRQRLTEQERFEQRRLSSQDILDLEQGKWDAFVDCRGAHLRTATEVPLLDLRANRGELLTIKFDGPPPKGLPEQHILNFGKWTVPVAQNSWRLGASYEWKRQDIEPNPETADFLLDAIHKATGCEAKLHIESHDVGIRPVSKDRRPLVGPCPNQDKWYVFNGLGTRGVLNGPRWSKTLIDIIQGYTQTPDLVNPKRLLI